MEKTFKIPLIFPLICGVQNYEWGRIGNDSAVFNYAYSNSLQLKQNGDEKNGEITQSYDQKKPYAELWMGSHPSLSSHAFINGTHIDLREIIKQNKRKILGEKLLNQFSTNDQLPFLFKVLSVNKALSIQAHPDKDLAIFLNKSDPTNYKDDNYKPEMCIALTEYEAFCTFQQKDDIIRDIQNAPELIDLFNEEDYQSFIVCNEQQSKNILKKLFTQVFYASKEKVMQQIDKLLDRLYKKEDKNLRDHLMIRLNTQQPKDVGILVSNFLNYFVLKPGQSLVMHSREPHAYLSGNCIECMANSDNVVRAGLTKKFIDVKTLTEMLTYNMGPPPLSDGIILQQSDKFSIRAYDSTYQEFKCYQILVNGQNSKSCCIYSQSPFILLSINGKGKILWIDQEDQEQQQQLMIGFGSTAYLCPNVKFQIISEDDSLNCFLCGIQEDNLQLSD